MAVDTFYHSGI